MRVLVTGAAGFIGSHLCDRLLEAGHDVAGIDNLSTGRRENLPADAQEHGTGWLWEGDLADLESLRAATGAGPRPELVVHCAASYDDRLKWHRDTATNVQGSINVGILAREWGARVVYFQTALIYGNHPYERFHPEVGLRVAGAPGGTFPLPTSAPFNPENSYAISKAAGEHYLRLADVPLLVFRLANIYGPRNLSGPVPAFYKRITEGQPCTIVEDAKRDFVYISDLCDLVMQAIDSDATGTYHVSTGRDYPIGQVYDAVVGALDAYGGPDPVFVPRGQDDAPTILLDPADTVRDFGWQATTDLDEGVEKAVGWYREHGVERTYTHLEMKG